jgi:tetratricopeptide (TPR) repeat protein
MEGLKIARRLAIENPEEYEHDLAIALSNLGHLYIDDMQRFTEGEAMYEESIRIRRHCLEEKHRQAYEPGLASVLELLAECYEKTGRYTECVDLYKEVLDIYNRLAIENPDRYNFEAKVTRNKLNELSQMYHIPLEEETPKLHKVWNWITRKNK